MSNHIVVDRSGRIATVTLNRADKRNALTTSMLAELEQIGRDFAKDEATLAIILRSEGEHFSVGADLNEVSSGEPPSTLAARRTAELGGKMMRALQEIHQPVICAVQGVSSGGATCIATACDFRIASREARMGYGEVKLGMNLMWSAVPPCTHLVGPARAKQLIMSGKLVDAETLESWGFVDEVCERDQLDERALAWAEEYAALPPVAVQMIKRSINKVCGALDSAIMHADADQWLLSSQTDDFQEAISAFKEKRTPRFTGN